MGVHVIKNLPQKQIKLYILHLSWGHLQCVSRWKADEAVERYSGKEVWKINGKIDREVWTWRSEVWGINSECWLKILFDLHRKRVSVIYHQIVYRCLCEAILISIVYLNIYWSSGSVIIKICIYGLSCTCDRNPHLIRLCSPPLSFSLPSLQILMSVLKESTTAGRTPCALTPLAPSCASAIRATSGSMTIPAQVSSSAGLLTGWNQVEKPPFLF